MAEPRVEGADREWLEADALGGFAMGTAAGVRTRRYHALLMPATEPPAGRVMLIADVEAWLTLGDERVPLSTHVYRDGVVHPRGVDHLRSFSTDPWPTWVFEPRPGVEVRAERLVEPLSGDVVLRWTLSGGEGELMVRPLLAGRDYHALQRENDDLRFDATVVGSSASWRPYPDRPAATALSNGTYLHGPDWYRGFSYAQEAARGLDDIEDLASPGAFFFSLGEDRPGVLVLRAGDAPFGDASGLATRHFETEAARRARFASPLARAADAYIVRRGRGRTVIAGFPWFTDWGRDTFIALRGLCLTTGRFEDGLAILDAWADTVSEGMLPNRFPDAGQAPEYNAVDASLLYCVAVGELFDTVAERGEAAPERIEARLRDAVIAILEGYSRGTRYRIHCDNDGLLAAGEPGVQLTWMDAKVGDWVVTPRIGKPVEIQALWINALRVGARWDRSWGALAGRAGVSFIERFVTDEGWLRDVVDVNHAHGVMDESFRPNQIFAVGGLPAPLLEGAAARRVVDAVEARLWTPLGLRSLCPKDPAYRGRYAGDPHERDGAYHQGTVWPWLIGPFIEAWLRVRPDSDDARSEARRRFVAPLLAHLEEAGYGHVSEIADGDAPHTARGAPFQAWSVAELLRADHLTRPRVKQGR